MALKKLASKLSSFKYGISSPDKIDDQIKNGVDFFDDNEGGATGFTPKTDLESLYHKVRDGNVVAGPTPPDNYPFRQHDFMTSPINNFDDNVEDDYTLFSRFPNEKGNFPAQSETFQLGENLPEFFDPISAPFGTILGPVEQSQFINSFSPDLDFPSRYPSDQSLTYEIFQDAEQNFGIDPSSPKNEMLGPFIGRNRTQIQISNLKRRGVYNQYGSLSFENRQIPNSWDESWLGDGLNHKRYFNETGKSIHISNEGQLNAGTRYGSIQTNDENFTQFIEFNPGNVLTDKPSALNGGFPQVPPYELEVERLYARGNTEFPLTPEKEPATKLFNILPVQSKAIQKSSFNEGYGVADYLSTVNLGPFEYQDFQPTTLDILAGVEGEVGSLDIPSDDIRYGGDNYSEVPAGLDSNNLFQTKNFRKVADPDRENHPFILREMGNKWGQDKIAVETPFDSAFGGIVRGAPTFTGYVDRVLQDRVRVGKFLLTSEGISFVAKQIAFQALNPTLETKVYNPLSTLSIVGANDLIDAFPSVLVDNTIESLGSSIVSLFFQIGHPERHLGNGRYENTLEFAGSRLQYQSHAFGIEIPDLNLPSSNTGIGFVDNFLNRNVTNLLSNEQFKKVDAGLITPIFGLSNPNKYAFPISSAPKSITNGVPSFLGSADLAISDVEQAQNKSGGTFNKTTSVKDTNEDGLIKRHSTLSYDQLNKSNKYEDNLRDITMVRLGLNDSFETARTNKVTNESFPNLGTRVIGKKINDNIGKQTNSTFLTETDASELGIVKGDINGQVISSDNIDKVNIMPIQSNKDVLPTDFIKFMFKDVVNNKFLVFRAVLDGISDSVTPEYSETKFIGRPDKVYNYQGTDRNVSFGFKIYPKTKQELPVLMEKLNYLIGMCYPSYTENTRMVSPFVELTLGDMFKDTPGLLSSLTATVEDATTWEIQEGLQFPHFISCQCEFKYIGGQKNVPVALGKFYEISWLDGSRTFIDDGRPTGTFERIKDDTGESQLKEIPTRTGFNYIDNIGKQGNQ